MSGQQRPGGRSAAVRRSVFDAALDIIRERGAKALNIPEVARRAGVHESSIYRRWGTSDRLLLEAALDLSEAMIVFPDTGSLAGDLVATAMEVTRYLESDLGRGLSAAMASVDDTAQSAAVRSSFWSDRLRAADRIFDRARARGEWPVHASSTSLVEAVIGQVYLRSLIMRRPMDDASAATVVRLLLDGHGMSTAVGGS